MVGLDEAWELEVTEDDEAESVGALPLALEDCVCVRQVCVWRARKGALLVWRRFARRHFVLLELWEP